MCCDLWRSHLLLHYWNKSYFHKCIYKQIQYNGEVIIQMNCLIFFIFGEEGGLSWPDMSKVKRTHFIICSIACICIYLFICLFIAQMHNKINFKKQQDNINFPPESFYLSSTGIGKVQLRETNTINRKCFCLQWNQRDCQHAGFLVIKSLLPILTMFYSL